jgi:allantoicase
VNPFTELPDLASRRLGGGVVHADDEFFAAADNLVRPEAPVFQRGTFGAKGQVYDGWETRRRRSPGHDRVIVRLGAPGVVYGLVIDTSFFTGNYPPFAAVEGCRVDGYPDPPELEAASWRPLLARSALRGDARNEFTVEPTGVVTHVRLTIEPDGGVARLRVHGEAVPDPELLRLLPVDLAALENGARVVEASNRFYSAPNNMLMPGPPVNMGDGWETARRRDDGHDWVLVRLAGAGRARLAELDTTHFKGNAPGGAALHGADLRDAAGPAEAEWFDLVPRTRLRPDTRHRFAVASDRVVTHARLDIYPDGGMARLRLFGSLEPAELDALAARRRLV